MQVFPLVALFFGTGNQTPSVSAAVIARVFLDPELRIFEYSPDRLLAETPRMFAFPNLETIFTTIASKIAPAATTHTCRTLKQVVRHADGTSTVTAQLANGSLVHGTFDQVVSPSPLGPAGRAILQVKLPLVLLRQVFACDAESILRSLDKPRWIEKWALGNVRYYDDLIITHEDEEYMRSHYHLDPQADDMYFVRTDPSNKERIEMSFHLSKYQPHLTDSKGQARGIFQSIFLNREDSDTWTVDRIDPAKVLKRRWTRVFAHTWSHFAFWVPFVRLLQGRKNTW